MLLDELKQSNPLKVIDIVSGLKLIIMNGLMYHMPLFVPQWPVMWEFLISKLKGVRALRGYLAPYEVKNKSCSLQVPSY